LVLRETLEGKQKWAGRGCVSEAQALVRGKIWHLRRLFWRISGERPALDITLFANHKIKKGEVSL